MSVLSLVGPFHRDSAASQSVLLDFSANSILGVTNHNEILAVFTSLPQPTEVFAKDGVVADVELQNIHFDAKNSGKEILVHAMHLLYMRFSNFAIPADAAAKRRLAHVAFNVASKTFVGGLVDELKPLDEPEKTLDHEEEFIQSVKGLVFAPTPFHYACTFIEARVDRSLLEVTETRALNVLYTVMREHPIMYSVCTPRDLGKAAARHVSDGMCPEADTLARNLAFLLGKEDEIRPVAPEEAPLAPMWPFAFGLDYIEHVFKMEDERIDEGTYGYVFRANSVNVRGLNVVVKRTKKPAEKRFGVDIDFLTEWGILTLVKMSARDSKKHIVELIGAYKTASSHFCLVLEKCDTNTLHDIIHGSGAGLGPNVAETYAAHLLKGLSLLHSYGVIHLDLKPKNLLIKNGILKVSDMGISIQRPCAQLMSAPSNVQTLWWRAPEVLGHGKYSFSADMWSVGCIISEMATGTSLFKAKFEIEMFKTFFETFGRPTERFDWPTYPEMLLDNLKKPSEEHTSTRIGIARMTPACARVARGCLVYDPENRLNAVEALEQLGYSRII